MTVKAFLNNKQFLSFAGNVVMSLLNLVTNAILYHYLPKPEMGVWVFFIVTFNFIDTFRTGLLQTAFIKFFAGTAKERGENVLGSTWFIGLLITALVCVITLPGFLLLGYIQNQGIIQLIKWAGVTFITTLPIVIATWLLQAEQQYGRILYIRLVNQASLIVFVIWCIYRHELNVTAILFTNLLSNVLTCILVFACGWTRLRSVIRHTRLAALEIYHFGKFSVGTSISSTLLRSSDTFIINFTLGSAPLAVYNLAQNLMNILEIPLRSFTTTAMTSLSTAQNAGRKEEVEKIFKKYTGTLTVLFIPLAIGALILADLAVKLYGGSAYVNTPAANIFRIFMIFAIFFPIDRFTGVTLDVINQPRVNFYKVLTMLLINVIGDFAGIYILHSIYGVGIASIPTFVIGTLFGYLSLKKFLNFNLTQILKTGYSETLQLIQTVWSRIAPFK